MSDAPLIHVTQSAVAKVHALIQEEANHDLKLRVYITGGGCSGFQYGFAFEESTESDDAIIETPLGAQDEPGDEGSSGTGTATLTPSVTVLVDPMSFQYLAGAEIDYQEDMHGAQFIIRNPNAKTTCGCGSSFSI